jgi:hypothetical protein
MLLPPIGFRDSGRSKVDTWTVSTRGRRVRRSRAQWGDLLERFATSGQSREEFCREQGLTVSSFDRWRRALGKTAAGGRAVTGAPLFLEVTSPASGAAGSWDVELELGRGVFLRLRQAC